MGLIKAAAGAIGGTFADQWREYFYADALPEDVLAVKASKRVGSRSSNKGDSNIISNGAVIAVNEGQFMLIVDQGRIVEFCGDPGEFIYDSSTEPSMLYGSFGEGLADTFKTIGRRFTLGGDTGRDQRVYFLNTKEIIGNKYGTPNPVPFRVVDRNIGLDVDVSIRCHGEYSYKLVDPLLFYANVCGNIEGNYTRSRVDSQLKSELMTALQPAFAKISAMGIRYSALPGHTMEIAEALNDVLSEKWSKHRGIAVASFGISSVTASQEDEEMIKNIQRTAVYRDPTMAAAQLVGAQSEAMVSAAKNTNAGPVMAFAGMNMANAAGGMNAQGLYSMGAQQAHQKPAADTWKCSCGTDNTGKFCSSCGSRKPSDNTWTCECGKVNEGKFCADCGKPKPSAAASDSWTCSCGVVNEGKFCSECGSKRPAVLKTYRCNKCGWEPEDKSVPPKFCPECGDRFDDNDVQI